MHDKSAAYYSEMVKWLLFGHMILDPSKRSDNLHYKLGQIMDKRLCILNLLGFQIKKISKGILTHNLLIVLLIFIGTTFSLSSPIDGAELGLKTGSTKGTYYQFGRDLSLLSKGYGLEIDVITSKGSFENLISILEDEKVQLAIVQHDVMAFITLTSEQEPSDKAFKAAVDKTRLMYPLYNEEVHILAKKTISSFEQLNGKRVAVGSPGSGTLLTSNIMLTSSGIRPGKRLEIGYQNALRALSNGKIDAMINVAGYPVKLFEEVSNPGGFHLLPIKNKAILDFYGSSVIPKRTYSWQPNDIDTVAVKAALVTYDYEGKDCRLVGKLGKIIAENIGWLRKYGHPKWKSVDLDFKLDVWKRSSCF